MQVETEYLGGRKAKLWTYVILLGVLILGVVLVNLFLKSPELARGGIDTVIGLPSWVLPVAVGALGAFIFWVGLKIETDWPEALGALLIAGSLAAGEMMIGWNHFAVGGLVVIPYVLPVAAFLLLLAIGMVKSR